MAYWSGAAGLVFGCLIGSGALLAQRTEEVAHPERFRQADVSDVLFGDGVAQDTSKDAVRLTDRARKQALSSSTQTHQAPSAEDASLSPAARRLRSDLRRCLTYYYQRPETTAKRCPWQTMHAILGFGVDTHLVTGTATVNAIGWLCWNKPCSGNQLFEMRQGQVYTRFGPGYQGHDGQFLQVMALARVPKDFVIKVDGQDFAIADVVRREQATCKAGTELSFKLLGLSHYLDSDTTWRNEAGESWSLPRMIQEELRQPVIGAACGGTHRLMGLGYSVRTRMRRGEPVTGQWAVARKYVEDYVAYAYRLQNANGSFSTQWFRGRGNSDTIDRQLETSGHTVQWLLLSLPDEQLSDSRLVRAVEFLESLMWQHRERDWPMAAKGHALHALVLYDERVFGAKPGQRSAAQTSG